MGAEREAPNGPRGLPSYDPAPDPHARARAFLRWGLAGLIVLAPLPFGSVQPLPVLLIELVAAVLGAVGVWVLVDSRERSPTWVPVVAATAAAACLWLIPIPQFARDVLSPSVERFRASVAPYTDLRCSAWLPSALSPGDALDAGLRVFAIAAVVLAASVAYRRSIHFRRLGTTIVAAGAFQAAYGLGEFLTGRQTILGWPKLHYLDSATGTFINRNHYALFVAIAIPFGLDLARGRRGHLPFSRILGLSVVALMWAGILASYSRGALAAGVIGSIVWSFAAVGKRRTVLLGLAPILLGMVALLGYEIRTPGARIVQIGDEFSSGGGRLEVWREAWSLGTLQPLVGFGPGSFESAYAARQGPTIERRYDHAHNEYLQTFVETGVLGLGVLLVATIGPFLWSRPRHDAPPTPVFAAGIGSVTIVAVHSLVDFPLRIPAIAVLVAIVFGSLLASVTARRVGRAQSSN